MPSQEELFRFFQKISEELYLSGYPILDNIIHPFPGVKFDEDIIREQKEDSLESDASLSEEEPVPSTSQ